MIFIIGSDTGEREVRRVILPPLILSTSWATADYREFEKKFLHFSAFDNCLESDEQKKNFFDFWQPQRPFPLLSFLVSEPMIFIILCRSLT